MTNNFTYIGKINLIIGPMFSEKTSQLIRRYKRYTIGGKKCLMVKYKGDTRYDNQMVVTHDNNKVEAVLCEYLCEVDELVNDYDVICVDEVQFYKDADILCDKWACQGKIIEACGLNGTFNRTPFDIISKLVPLVDSITYLTAICKETGGDAIFSKLIINDNTGTTEIIGGSDKYISVDRKTYFESQTGS